MENPTISVVINTYNEEGNIQKCIESVVGFADEILVCDMYSDDKTVEIAKNLGATIIYHEKVGFVEPARFYAISKAQCDWILILDADEYVETDFRNKIKEIILDRDVDLITVGKLYFYFVKYIRRGGFYLQKCSLFFKKDLYVHNFAPENMKIFNGFTHLKGASIKTIDIGDKYHIMHDAYPSIEKFVIKTNGKYAAIEAAQMYSDGKKFSLLRLFVDPTKTFIKKYFFKLGFLEGTNGFILCVLYANFRFNVWANLWQLENSK